MIVTSNKPFSAWGAIFCDEVVAAALMDRLVDHSEIVSLQGDSYRLKDKTSAAPRRPTPPEPRGPGRAAPLRPTASAPQPAASSPGRSTFRPNKRVRLRADLDCRGAKAAARSPSMRPSPLARRLPLLPAFSAGVAP
jgi:hypothetical protein